MPLMKYFCYVGSILVAVLCAANWLFADPARQSADSGAENYGIRIRSTAKLPDPVVFDTSLPTIVLPPTDVTIAAQMPQEAFAQIVPTQVSVAALGHQFEKKRKVASHSASNKHLSTSTTDQARQCRPSCGAAGRQDVSNRGY